MYTDGQNQYRTRFGYAFEKSNEWLQKSASVSNGTYNGAEDLHTTAYLLPAYPVIFLVNYFSSKTDLQKVK